MTDRTFTTERRALLAAALALGVAATLPTGAGAQWTPNKPINVIVPWGAGGSTDQVVRVVAAEVEKALGQKIVVVNQPGASGSIGTKSVIDAPKDGYTWASGAAKDLGSYKVAGMAETVIGDWHLYLAVINASVIGVNANAPYQTLPDLIAAMKAKPGAVTVATAGVTSSGGDALRQLQSATGERARQVTYDGGNPAVIATAGGETEVTTQLAVEQMEMLRAKRLRGLAVASSRPLMVEGVGEIPPVTKFLPNYPLADNYFGIFVPKGVPAEVTATLDKIWTDVLPKSEALKAYAGQRGAIVAVVHGEAAQKAVMPAISSAAWGLVERNQSKVDPATLGIPKPAN